MGGAKRSKSFYMTGANPNFWGFVDTAVELKQRGCSAIRFTWKRHIYMICVIISTVRPGAPITSRSAIARIPWGRYCACWKKN